MHRQLTSKNYIKTHKHAFKLSNKFKHILLDAFVCGFCICNFVENLILHFNYSVLSVGRRHVQQNFVTFSN